MVSPSLWPATMWMHWPVTAQTGPAALSCTAAPIQDLARRRDGPGPVSYRLQPRPSGTKMPVPPRQEKPASTRGLPLEWGATANRPQSGRDLAAAQPRPAAKSPPSPGRPRARPAKTPGPSTSGAPRRRHAVLPHHDRRAPAQGNGRDALCRPALCARKRVPGDKSCCIRINSHPVERRAAGL